jgi:hypothetical protein
MKKIHRNILKGFLGWLAFMIGFWLIISFLAWELNPLAWAIAQKDPILFRGMVLFLAAFSGFGPVLTMED